MRRRLYLQIYFGVVSVALVVLLVAGWVAREVWFAEEHTPHSLEAAAAEIAGRLEGNQVESAQKLTLLAEAAEIEGVTVTVFSRDGERLVTNDPRIKFLDRIGRRFGRHTAGSGDMHFPGRPGTSVQLPDGRWVRVAPNRWRRGPVGGPFSSLALVLVALGLGAYPVSRRITRRLERLQDGVEQLAGGDLAARVTVEGKDEVAELARAFNGAADQIEDLVETQRRLLASASHELRTPLARLRVAIELLAKEPRQELRDEAARDIAELDELIEDLLLAARMQDPRPAPGEEINLLELARKEASHYQAEAVGVDAIIRGNRRALTRLVRNLLENATRYGEPPIEIWVADGVDEGVLLDVTDAGSGVPEEERERIFEPFYRPGNHSEGEHGGVGLGLALVREIARHHGGEARCVEKREGGTCFRVFLRDLE